MTTGVMPTARTLCWHSGGHEAPRHANQKDTVMSGSNTKLIGPIEHRDAGVPSGHPTHCGGGGTRNRTDEVGGEKEILSSV
jgi:hypothetical protein